MPEGSQHFERGDWVTTAAHRDHISGFDTPAPMRGTPPVALLLRHVVHHRRHHWLHRGLSSAADIGEGPKPLSSRAQCIQVAKGHQEAFDPHVVILCDPLHIPATDLPESVHERGMKEST